MAIPEAKVRVAAMKELLAAPGCRLTTSQLIEKLSKRMTPTGHDAAIAVNRSDTYFSQKVRNLVSHRNQTTGLQASGYADYDAPSESWTLTKMGRSKAATL